MIGLVFGRFPCSPDQLVETLRLGLTSSPEIGRSAVQHGHALLLHGFTVSQVVHDCGDVCQAITELAVELHTPIIRSGSGSSRMNCET